MTDPIIKRAVSKNYTHPNYAETVAYAKQLKQIITGRDIDELLKQFTPNEDEATFEQRKRITKQITPSVCKNLMDVYNKVPRSTSQIKIFKYPNDNVKKEFQEILKDFNGTKSFDDYCATTFIAYNWLDPNAFIVIDWKEFDNKKERAKPYPFFVSSEMAIDYEYKNNILQYLLVKQTTDKLDKYTIYYPNYCLIYEQVEKVDSALQGQTRIDGDTWMIGDVTYVVIDNKTFLITEPLPHHDLGMVNAFRIGGIDSYAYEGTVESILQPCLPYLHKSIKSVSEMDLTQALHCFPQKFLYAPPCPKCSGMTPDVDSCKYCHGSGSDIHTTAGNAITIRLPKKPDPTQMIDLSTLVHYEYPPIDGITWQDGYINSLTSKCKETLFNTDVFSKQEIAETATGKNISLQNVYDTLYPFALHYSDFWEWGVDLISQITELSVEATLKFSKDFKFKTKDDYIAELKAAKEAGANPEIIENIQNEIVKIDSEDNQDAMRVYFVKQQYYPFRDKNDQQIAMLLSKLPSTNPYVVLWTYFGEIFEQIEKENIDFYKLDWKKRDEIVKAKIDEFAKLNKPVEAPVLEPVV